MLCSLVLPVVVSIGFQAVKLLIYRLSFMTCIPYLTCCAGRFLSHLLSACLCQVFSLDNNIRHFFINIVFCLLLSTCLQMQTCAYFFNFYLHLSFIKPLRHKHLTIVSPCFLCSFPSYKLYAGVCATCIHKVNKKCSPFSCMSYDKRI